MSGIYDITRFTDGYHDENVYFHNPIGFLASVNDPDRLSALGKLAVILAVGREGPLFGQNEHLSALPWKKAVGHALLIWNGLAHDWPAWAHLLPLYISGPE